MIKPDKPVEYIYPHGNGQVMKWHLLYLDCSAGPELF
jgi:hypothetical protein